MAESIRRVRPTPSDAYLANPHRGCCTFQRFEGDELFSGTTWSEEGPTGFPERRHPGAAPGYLPTTVAYCRWFWRLFEPEEGVYDFSIIDRALETARTRGQTLAIRIMAFGSIPAQPMVPDWYARRYALAPVTRDGRSYPIPDHESEDYLRCFGALIRACGERYDGHADLESVDVGYIGPWGEGAASMSAGRMRDFARVHAEAFTRTPLLCEICGEQGGVGIEAGMGWRWNCFGDLSDGGSAEVTKRTCWNHHFDEYPESVVRNRALDRWTTRPIHFETCWVPTHWFRAGWDLDFILQQGLKFRPTYFMPKSCALPEPWLDRLADFCERIGYRFVFRQARYESRTRVGGDFAFTAWIENVGVAPIYRRYDFALRLRQGDRSEIVRLADVDIRAWMPGDAIVDARVALPAGFTPGYALLSAGLVDPRTGAARVSFAAQEVFSDRWLDLGGVEITA